MALATPPMRFQGWPLPTSPSGNDSPAVDSESLEGARNDRCSHSIAVSADQWPDDLRLSNIVLSELGDSSRFAGSVPRSRICDLDAELL